MKYILGVVLLTLAGFSQASEFEPIESCWDAPQFRESGAPLSLAEIDGFDISYDYSGDGIKRVWLPRVDRNTRCVTVYPTKVNEICFKGITVDTNGVASGLSNEVCKVPVRILVNDTTPPNSPTMYIN